jgi:hypothetical protein
MRAGSTGLGKTELSFNLFSVNRQEKEILFRGKTYDPVIWDIRVIITPTDIPMMLKLLSEDITITTIQEWLKELDQKDFSSYFDALQIVLAKIPDMLGMIRDKNILVKAFEALSGLSKEQMIGLLNAIKKLLAAEGEFDTFLKAASITLKGVTKMAILLLDEDGRDLLSGLLVHIKGGAFPSILEGIDRIEKIDLNLEVNGKRLNEMFKSKAMLNAVKEANQIIQSKYGGSLLTVVFDIKTFNEVLDALDIRIGKVNGEFFNEIVRLIIKKFLRGDIVIEPIPHLIDTIQKISLAV